MDATQYMHILYTDTHVCKWYIHELKPTLYMCHYMPFQALYLSRFFGSYLRGGIAQRYSLRYFEAWNYPMPAMVTRLTLPALVWRLACVRAPKVYPSVGIMWYQTSWPVMQLNWELHYIYDICSQYLVLLYRFTSFNHISIWEYNPNSLHALHIH